MANSQEQLKYLRDMLQRKRESSSYDSFVNPNDIDYTNDYSDYINAYDLTSLAKIKTDLETRNTADPTEEKDNTPQGVMDYWKRTSDTIAAAGINVTRGLLNFFDSLGDLFFNIVDASSGHDAEWAREARDYDWVTYGTNAINVLGTIPTLDFENWAQSFNSIEESKEYLDKIVNESNWLSEAQGVNNFMTGVEESIGFMLPSIIAGVLTGGSSTAAQAVSLGVMGTGSFATGYNETYKKTDDVGKSAAYGTANAAIEVASELVTGKILNGISKATGLNKVIGEFTPNVNGLKYGSKAFASATKKGIGKEILKSMFEEGAEEVFSEILAPWASTIVKGEDALKGENGRFIYTDPAYWKQVGLSFAGGAVSGGIMSGGETAIVYNKLGAEGYQFFGNIGEIYQNQEAYNKLMLNKNISEETRNKRLQKLGEKNAQEMQELCENLDKFREDDPVHFNNLMNMLFKGKTAVDYWKSEQGENTFNHIKTTIQNSNLQNLASEFDAGIRKTTGLEFNTHIITENEIKNVDEFEKQYNLKLTEEEKQKFKNNDFSVAAFTVGNRTFISSEFSDKLFNKYVHENLSHGFFDQNPELRKAVSDVIKKANPTQWENTENYIRELYSTDNGSGNKTISPELLESETLAFTLENFTDAKKLIKDIAYRPTLFKLKHYLESVFKRIQNGRGDIVKSEKTYIKALTNLVETQLADLALDNIKAQANEVDNYNKKITGSPNYSASFSLSMTDSDGNKLSKEQQEFFKDSKVRDENGNLLVVYHGTPNNDFDTFERGDGEHGKGFYFTDDIDYASDYTNGEAGRIIKSYLNIENPLSFDTSLDNPSMKKLIKKIQEKWGLAKKTIENVFTSYGNHNEDWSSDLGSKIAKKMGYGKEDVADYLGWEVEDLDDFEEVSYNAYLGSYAWSSGLNDLVRECGFDGIISRIYNDWTMGYEYIAFNSNQIKEITNEKPTNNPSIKMSLDSKGNKLTEKQTTYFKNTKIKDSNGNLKVMYHGTSNPGFAIFDKKMSQDAFFFTDDLYNAKTYTSKFQDKEIYETYLNIINPYIIDAKYKRWDQLDFGKTKKEGYTTWDNVKKLVETGKINKLEQWEQILRSIDPFDLTNEFAWFIENELEKGKTYSEIEKDFFKNIKDDITWLNDNYDMKDDEIISIGSYVENVKTQDVPDYSTTRDVVKMVAKMNENGANYDGIVFNNIIDFGDNTFPNSQKPHQVVVAFEPNQIKSIDNTNPTNDNNIKFSIYDKTYKIPDTIKEKYKNEPNRYGWLEDYNIKVVDLEKIIKANHLDDASHGAFSRRTERWGTRDNFASFDDSYKEDWLYSPIRINYKGEIVDGYHRIYALYNDGYKKAEVLVSKNYDESELKFSKSNKNSQNIIKYEKNNKNIDKLEAPNYNEIDIREVENEFRRIQEESRRITNQEQQLFHQGSKEIDETLRKRLSTTFKDFLRSKSSISSYGYGLLKLNDDYSIYQDVDAQTFHDIFEISKIYLKNGELVDLHDVKTSEEHGVGYEETQNFLSDDGLSGFAITQDGDLISVFNVSGKSGWLRAISNIVKNNVKTLDCYASVKQPLNTMYSNIFGFKTASIMDYNMKYDHDDIAKNHNMQQVAFMVNTGENIETKHFNKDQYDEAVDYQHSFVKFSIIPEIGNNSDLRNIASRLTEENQKKLIEINKNPYLKGVSTWVKADMLDNPTIEFIYDYMKARNDGIGEYPNYERISQLQAYKDAEKYLVDHKEDLAQWSETLFNKVVNESFNKIIDNKKTVSTENQPELFMVTGLPGVGKSSTGVDKKIKVDGFVENDNDIFKTIDSLKKYYNNGAGAGVVQGIVGKAQDYVSNRLFKNRYNVAIPLVGKKASSIAKWVSMAKENGYKVVWRHVNGSEELSLSSSFVRYLQKGRYVSLDYIHNDNDSLKLKNLIDNTVKEILNNGGVVKYNGKEYRIDDYEGVERSLQQENERIRNRETTGSPGSRQRGYDIPSESRESNSRGSDVLSRNELDNNKVNFSLTSSNNKAKSIRESQYYANAYSTNVLSYKTSKDFLIDFQNFFDGFAQQSGYKLVHTNVNKLAEKLTIDFNTQYNRKDIDKLRTNFRELAKSLFDAKLLVEENGVYKESGKSLGEIIDTMNGNYLLDTADFKNYNSNNTYSENIVNDFAERMAESLLSNSKTSRVQSIVNDFKARLADALLEIRNRKAITYATVKAQQNIFKIKDKFDKQTTSGTTRKLDGVPQLQFYKNLINNSFRKNVVTRSKLGISRDFATALYDDLSNYSADQLEQKYSWFQALRDEATGESLIERYRDELGLLLNDRSSSSSRSLIVGNELVAGSRNNTGGSLSYQAMEAVYKLLGSLNKELGVLIDSEKTTIKKANYKADLELRALNYTYGSKERVFLNENILQRELNRTSAPDIVIKNFFGSNSAVNKVLFEDIFASRNAHLLKQYEFINDFKEIQEKYNIKDKDLSKKVEITLGGKNLKITIDTLLDIYTMTLTEATYRTIINGGYRYNDGKTKFNIILNESDIETIKNKLGKTYTDFAEDILDNLYNGEYRDYKAKKDADIKGYEILLYNDNYYPSNKSDTKNITIESQNYGTINIENTAINKERKKTYHMALLGMSFTDRNAAYVNALTKYGEMSDSVRRFESFINGWSKNSDNKAETRKSLIKNTSNELYTIINYLIERIGGKNDYILSGKGISNLVQATLYGNASVVLKQTASLPTVLNEVHFASFLKAFFKIPHNVLNYSKIKQDLMSKSGLLADRWSNHDIIKAAALTEYLNKFSKIFGVPMEKMDEAVIIAFAYGAAIEESKITGEDPIRILERIVANTQSNAIDVKQSMARSGAGGYIRKVLSYFSSDLQNKISILNNLLNEKRIARATLPTVNKMIETTKADIAELERKYQSDPNDETLEELNNKKEKLVELESIKSDKETIINTSIAPRATKFMLSLLLSGMIIAGIDELIKRLLGKKDWSWGEEDAKDFIKTLMLESTIDNLPYVSTIISAVDYNQEINGMDTTVINQFVVVLRDIVNAIENDGDWLKAVRDGALIVANLTGIPFNNLYKYMVGAYKNFSPNGYKVDALIKGYSPNYLLKEYKDAAQTNFTRKAKGYLELVMASRVESSEDVRDELLSLTKDGYNALPKAYMTSYTNDNGDVVELTKEQINAFKTEYNKANAQVEKLMQLTDYRNKTSEEKAKLIKKIYDTYYSYAKAKVLKLDKADNKLSTLLYYSNGRINISRFVNYLDKIGGITESKNKTRKELVIAYVNRLGLSRNDKLLLLYLAGYRSKDNNEKLSRYLRSLGLSSKKVSNFLS